MNFIIFAFLIILIIGNLITMFVLVDNQPPPPPPPPPSRLQFVFLSFRFATRTRYSRVKPDTLSGAVTQTCGAVFCLKTTHLEDNL